MTWFILYLITKLRPLSLGLKEIHATVAPLVRSPYTVPNISLQYMVYTNGGM